MRKSCLSLALVLLLASAALPAEDVPKLTIRWHGQSFFEIISTKGTRIVIDPHAIEAYGRKVVQADIVLISHFHDDHTQLSVVENAKQAKVLYGLKMEKGEGRTTEEWNVLDEKIKDVRIQSIGTYHDNMGGMQRGKNGVFIIDVDGLRIVHLGDLGHPLTSVQLKRIGAVDILMVPVGGVYTLNGLDAAKVVAQIKPKRYIFPMHYGTLVYDYLLKPDAFLDEFKKETIKKFTVNQFQIDPKAPVPEEPTILMLHWRGDK
jgi:L-ascorbate metabolism protein UlaG (beta-lactamase superfamily)